MTEHTDRITSQLLRAAVSKFEADRQKELALLDLYLHSSVGVGDHPTIVDEITSATTRLVEAEEALGTLQRNFFPQTAPQADDDE